jgi:hypothetical protein
MNPARGNRSPKWNSIFATYPPARRPPTGRLVENPYAKPLACDSVDPLARWQFGAVPLQGVVGCEWRTSRRAPRRRRSGCCSRAILAWGAAWSVRTPTTSRRAWDPIGNGRTSARAIFGVFYGGISGNSWNQTADPSRSPPGGSSTRVHSLADPYADMGGNPSPYVFNSTSPRFAPRVVALAVPQRDHQWVQLREHR